LNKCQLTVVLAIAGLLTISANTLSHVDTLFNKDAVTVNNKIKNNITTTVSIPSKEVERNKFVKNEIVINGETHIYKRKINIVGTFYTNSKADCGKTDGITKSGLRASRGIIATPPDIAFGTNIVLEDKDGNMKKYSVQDRGSAIKWIDENTMKVDIFIPKATAKQIQKLGKKYYTGYILEN
jgi:hypothetical protein